MVMLLNIYRCFKHKYRSSLQVVAKSCPQLATLKIQLSNHDVLINTKHILKICKIIDNNLVIFSLREYVRLWVFIPFSINVQEFT